MGWVQGKRAGVQGMLPVRTRRVAHVAPSGEETFALPPSPEELFVGQVERTAWFADEVAGEAGPEGSHADGALEETVAPVASGDEGATVGENAAGAASEAARAVEEAERKQDVTAQIMQQLQLAGAELDLICDFLKCLEGGHELSATSLIQPLQSADEALRDSTLWAQQRGDSCRACAGVLRAGAAGIRKRSANESRMYATLGRLTSQWKVRRTPSGFVVDLDHRRAVPRPDGKLHVGAVLVRTEGAEAGAGARGEPTPNGAAEGTVRVEARLQSGQSSDSLLRLQVEVVSKDTVVGDGDAPASGAGATAGPATCGEVPGADDADALHQRLLEMQHALMQRELFQALQTEALRPANAVGEGLPGDGNGGSWVVTAASDSFEILLSQRIGLKAGLRSCSGVEGVSAGVDHRAEERTCERGGGVGARYSAISQLLLESAYMDWCSRCPRGAIGRRVVPMPALLEPVRSRLLQRSLVVETLSTLEAAVQPSDFLKLQRLRSAVGGASAAYRLSVGARGCDAAAASTLVISHPSIYVEGSVVPLAQLGALGSTIISQLSVQALHSLLLAFGFDARMQSGHGVRVVLPSGDAAAVAMDGTGSGGHTQWSVARCSVDDTGDTQHRDTAASNILNAWLGSTDAVAAVRHLTTDGVPGRTSLERIVHLLARIAV